MRLIVVLFVALGMTLASALSAQTPARPNLVMPVDEAAYKKALAIAEPGPQLSAILQFLTEYPNSRSVPLMIGRAFTAAEKVGQWDKGRAVELAADIGQRLAKASSMARADADRTLGQRLLAKNLALVEAERYARQSAAELNTDDHVARERQWYQQKVDLFTARDAKYKALPFYVEEAREKYRGLEAATWSTLGRVLIAEGRDGDARVALEKSLASARTADAAMAVADLARKRSDARAELDALATAVLTGKTDRAASERFYAAYAASGMRPGAEAWLDTRYRLGLQNTLQGGVNATIPAEPRRAVLLEMVTGAACEPCVSVDLAIDALLRRYSRGDVVVIAHHMHAPSTDPLVSGAAEERTKFYEVRGAPTVLLDGEAIEPGEGTGSVARPVFDALDAAIQKRMAVKADGAIRLKSWWEGEALKVEAVADEFVPGPKLRLQVYLVETEVSYSGENGFRMHSMVNRSAARAGEGGFTVSSVPFRAEWSFALDAMPGQLQKYMDGYLNGMRARFPARTFQLREAWYGVDRTKLGIVAVLQDAESKRVLQSAYLQVGGGK
jgi:hypothetical protein